MSSVSAVSSLMGFPAEGQQPVQPSLNPIPQETAPQTERRRFVVIGEAGVVRSGEVAIPMSLEEPRQQNVGGDIQEFIGCAEQVGLRYDICRFVTVVLVIGTVALVILLNER
jgi:hypothetical protein